MNRKILIACGAAVACAGAGAWYFLARETASPPVVSGSVEVVASAPPVAAAPAMAHPLPKAGADSVAAAPLPTLDDSDAELLAALPAVIGAGAVRNYLEPQAILRRIVVTVDNLPRQKVPVDKRPVHGLASVFRVDGDELHATLDARNYARYQPLVAVVRNLDVTALTGLYLRFYPLLQRAYQDLGYPDGYFNDRLIAAIDVLLAAPQVPAPIELVRPNVMYEFADPELEKRPAGQKLMIRMGPENALAVKAKLTELRAALTAAP